MTRKYQQWTTAEDSYLLTHRGQVSLEQIGAHLGRNHRAVRCRLVRLTRGVKPKPKVANQADTPRSRRPSVWANKSMVIGEVIHQLRTDERQRHDRARILAGLRVARRDFQAADWYRYTHRTVDQILADLYHYGTP